MIIQLLDNLPDERHKELDAKELPYKGGWQSGDNRHCLPGT
jgi:hypothetical protein